MRRIALLLQLSTSFERSMVQGMRRVAEERGWQLLAAIWGDLSTQVGHRSDLAGAIADLSQVGLGEHLLALGIPVVNVGPEDERFGFPRVATDDRECGRLAARHFQERNLRSFAFVGSGSPVDRERLEGFRQQLELPEEEVPWHRAPTDWSLDYAAERERLVDWLRALGSPVGVFVSNDILARRVVQCAVQCALRVPEDVSVVGVGDYELLNQLAPISLSSVVQDAEEIGAQAASLLDRMLTSGSSGYTLMSVPPKGMVTRQSSDVTAVSDPRVAEALQLMRDRLDQQLSVADVASELNVSRRWLELKFREHLDRSPRQMLHFYRLERARRLLVESDVPLRAVAEQCGLGGPERFSKVFRQAHGMPPRRYRRQLGGS